MKRRIAVGIGLGALAAFVAWLLVSYDFSLLAELPASTIAILVALSVIYLALYGVGIALILRSLGAQRSLWRVYLVVSGAGTASYLGNFQLSVPVRLLLFNRLLDISYASGAASVALESVCWMVLMGAGLLLASASLDTLPWSVVIALLVLFCIALRYSIPILRLLTRLTPGKLAGVSLQPAKTFAGDLILALTRVQPSWLLVATILFTLNYAIDAYSLSLVVSVYDEHLSLWEALRAVILSYLAGLVTLIPMGLGVRDVSMVALLVKSGVSVDVATTATIVQRLLRTAIPLPLGFLSANLLGLREVLRRPTNPLP